MVRLSVDRRFEFGKYEGLTFSEVLEKDSQYIEYMSTKISWLFNDSEKQKLRNFIHRERNKDVLMVNVKSRTPFEEEMYGVFNRF